MQFAWWMAWNELKHKPVALVLNGIVSAFVGALFGLILLSEIYFEIQSKAFNLFFSMDFLIIAIMPLLGSLYLSKEYLSFHTMVSNKPFMKRLQFYRMWAIPLKTIAWSRMFYMIICLVVALIGFIGAFVVVTWSTYSELWGSQSYLIFIIVLTSYAVALSGMNPYLEFVIKGKTILIGQTLYMLLAIIFVIGLNILTERPLHSWVVDIASNHPWIVSGIAVLTAAAGILLFQRLLVSGLKRKEFM